MGKRWNRRRAGRQWGVAAAAPTPDPTGWVDVCDFTFSGMSSQAFTEDAENTVTGTSHIFWMKNFDTGNGGAAGITNGTGLQVSFCHQNNQKACLLYKGTGIAKVNGAWPRFRLVASISNITFASNGDAIMLWMAGSKWDGSNQYVPIYTNSYKRNSSTAYRFRSGIRTGTVGAGGGSSNSSEVTPADPDGTTITLDLYEGEAGKMIARATEGSEAIPDIGTGTLISSGFLPDDGIHSASDEGFWDGGSDNTGPWLGLMFISKGSSGSTESCVIKKFKIQKYVG